MSESLVCCLTYGHRAVIVFGVAYIYQGWSGALAAALLQARRETRATLLVRPENTTAYQAYTRWAGAGSPS